MHIKLNSLLLIAFILLPNFSQGQDNFEIPDFNPPRFGGNQQQKGLEPSTQSDIQSRPSSIKVNQLRSLRDDFGPSDRQAPATENPDSYDSQPLPPARRGRFSNSGQTAPQINQDPLNTLNPNRIIPPITTQNNDRTFTPPINQTVQQPQRRQTLPPITPKQPTMTPRISDSVSGDSRVVPSSFSSPQASTTQQPARNQQRNQNAQSSKTIIGRYDVSSNNRPLPGVPVSLEDMMRTTPLQYRKAMVQQYWETYFDWATLQNYLQHSNWLKSVANPRSRPEQMLLQTAKLMSRNDVTAAEIQLSKSQSKLQQLSQSKTGELLPLPLNQPLVTNYNSHYDWYEARNLIPEKLKGINEMLPRTYKLIAERAKTAAQADNARKVAAQAFSGGQIGLGDLLAAGSAWKSSLQGFVSTVVNYNHAISDYALTITSPQKPIEQVVSMLVAKPKSVNEIAQQNSQVQQTANSRPTLSQTNTQPQRIARQPNNRIQAAGSNAGPFRQTGSRPTTGNQGFVRTPAQANSNDGAFNSGAARRQGSTGLPPISSAKAQTPGSNFLPPGGRSDSSISDRGAVQSQDKQPLAFQPRSNANAKPASEGGAGNGGGSFNGR